MNPYPIEYSFSVLPKKYLLIYSRISTWDDNVQSFHYTIDIHNANIAIIITSTVIKILTPIFIF